MTTDWFIAAPGTLAGVAIKTVILYFIIIVATRISGVRSFAQLSTFDIAVTIALGSLIASIIVQQDPPLLQGVVAIVCLYGLQLGISRLRNYLRCFEKLTDNRPILLMGPGGEIKHANLKVARVTVDDLRGHLRQANVSDLSTVHAMVMEGTGAIHVLHGQHDLTNNDWVLQNIRDYSSDAAGKPPGSKS